MQILRKEADWQVAVRKFKEWKRNQTARAWVVGRMIVGEVLGDPEQVRAVREQLKQDGSPLDVELWSAAELANDYSAAELGELDELVLSSEMMIAAITDRWRREKLRADLDRLTRKLDKLQALRGLVVETIDPELARVVFGPEVGAELEHVYELIRSENPTSFIGVEPYWERQRESWRPLAGADAGGGG